MDDHYELKKWEQLQKGQSQSLDFFYEKYVQSLYNYGCKITNDHDLIKDCIQDLFIDIWRARQSLSVPKSPRFYLLKSLRYKIIRQVNQRNHYTQLKRNTEDEYEPSVEDLLVDSQQNLEKNYQLHQALNKLSSRQKEAVTLKFFESLSYEEIADIMEIQSQSAYNLIHQSLGILKKYLSNEITLYGISAAVIILLFYFLGDLL